MEIRGKGLAVPTDKLVDERESKTVSIEEFGRREFEIIEMALGALMSQLVMENSESQFETAVLFEKFKRAKGAKVFMAYLAKGA
jgi:hypothetical protein